MTKKRVGPFFCNKCNLVEVFGQRKVCDGCKKKYQAAWMREWRKNNPEKSRNSDEKFRKNNRKKRATDQNKYYHKTRDVRVEKLREDYKKNGKMRNRRRRSDVAKNLWQRARVRCKKSGLDFTISIEDVRTVLTELCPVFGTKMHIDGLDGGRLSVFSLDRVDNSKGYVPGNVRVISLGANRLKNNGTLEQFRAIVRYLEGHFASLDEQVAA